MKLLYLPELMRVNEVIAFDRSAVWYGDSDIGISIGLYGRLLPIVDVYVERGGGAI